MDTSFQYFAYGSNLSSARIRLNNPSAVAVGPAILRDYKLDFNYFSKVTDSVPESKCNEHNFLPLGLLMMTPE